MPKVNMPRASWDSVLSCLDILIKQGYYVQDEYNEIESQVDRQEN